MRKLRTVSFKTIRQKQNNKKFSIIDNSFIRETFFVVKKTTLGLSLLTTSMVAGGLVGLAISFRDLPNVRTLSNYSPSETSYVYDIKGKLISRLHGEANREAVAFKQISPHLKRAVLAIEDSHFYLHHGINPNSYVG